MSIILDFVKDCFEFEAPETQEVAGLLFNSELNFNNADKTSEQRIYSEKECLEEVKRAIEELKKDDDYCSNCGKKLSDEEFTYFSDMVTNDPYPMYQDICDGYLCSGCGYKENF